MTVSESTDEECSIREVELEISRSEVEGPF